MNEPATPTIGTKLLATVENAFYNFMSGKDAPPLQPGDSMQAAWERFRACLMAAARAIGDRYVSFVCTCKPHHGWAGDIRGIVTNEKCEIHGTCPSPAVKAIRAGMGQAEVVATFGVPAGNLRTLKSGRVIDLSAMTAADIAEAHNDGTMLLGPASMVFSVVGDSRLTYSVPEAVITSPMTETKCDGGGMYDHTEGTSYEQRGEWIQCPGCPACKPGDLR